MVTSRAFYRSFYVILTKFLKNRFTSDDDLNGYENIAK